MAYKKNAGISKKNVSISSAIVHVHAGFNNTIVTATDLKGNVLTFSSSGTEGFSGSKKKTQTAVESASETVAVKLKEFFNVRTVSVVFNGPGQKDGVVKAVSKYLITTSLIDITGKPHNGCRLRKKPRN